MSPASPAKKAKPRRLSVGVCIGGGRLMLFFSRRLSCVLSKRCRNGSTQVLRRMVGKWVGADNTIECDGETTAREKRKVDKFAFCAKYIWEFLSKVFRLGAGERGMGRR